MQGNRNELLLVGGIFGNGGIHVWGSCLVTTVAMGNYSRTVGEKVTTTSS
jgi:hypothetical protein